MDSLDSKLAKAIQNIYDMQSEAAVWNRLNDNFHVLNYCYVDSLGVSHDDTLQHPNLVDATNITYITTT